MAQSRRVCFTTLTHDVPCSRGEPPSDRATDTVRRTLENHPGQTTDAVRLVLTLFDPDERTFPEFSYSQLINSEVKQELSPRNCEEDKEAVAIVKKLEEKYGGKPKKRDRIQDLIDIGYGYEEDSFIDNSEAYDEFVPASITTKFGGFYVNSGLLQFRHASDTEDLTTSEETPEATKKRKLNLGQDKPKKKLCSEDGEITCSVDQSPCGLSETGPNDVMKKKKKKKATSTLSVTSMLKKFQREKEKERHKFKQRNQKVAAVTGAATTPLYPADAAGGGGPGLNDPLLSLIGSTNDNALIQAANTVDFDIDLESLLEVSEGTSSPKSLPQLPPEAQLFQPKAAGFTQVRPPNTYSNLQLKPSTDPVQLLSQTTPTFHHLCVPPLEGIPQELNDTIQKLNLAALPSEGDSKVKFFTPEINSILLHIELQCREQGGQLRSKLYTHLSSFLPCSRDTLLKRAKKLLHSHIDESTDVENPLSKLKEAIGKAMPEQIAHFHENCLVHKLVKTSSLPRRCQVMLVRRHLCCDYMGFVIPPSRLPAIPHLGHNPDTHPRWDDKPHIITAQMTSHQHQVTPLRKTEGASSQNVKAMEEKEGKNAGPEDRSAQEKAGNKGGPKKLFKWNEEIRECLCHVLEEKIERYKTEKKEDLELEEYLKTLLDNEVKPLWPKGWMQSRVLMKESRKILNLSAPLFCKKNRPEKKSAVSSPMTTSDDGSVLQASPPLRVLPQEGGDGITEKKAIAPKNLECKNAVEMAADSGSSTSVQSDKSFNLNSLSTNSPLELLADQALAREQPVPISQELLAAAVAKYKHSVQQWSIAVDAKSIPLPPPPPHPSPVGFPLKGVCQVVLPQLLQVGDFATYMDAGQAQMISNDANITIQ